MRLDLEAALVSHGRAEQYRTDSIFRRDVGVSSRTLAAMADVLHEEGVDPVTIATVRRRTLDVLLRSRPVNQ